MTLLMMLAAFALGCVVGAWWAWMMWRERFWQYEWQVACDQQKGVTPNVEAET